MKETAEIRIVSVRAVRGKLPEQEIANFIRVSYSDTTQAFHDPECTLFQDGWKVVMENPISWKVTIELPEGVHDGPFKVANVPMIGLYGDCDTRDGIGRAVCASVPTVKFDYWEDRSRAIAEALKDGVCLHLPTNHKDHSRSVMAKVVQWEEFHF